MSSKLVKNTGIYTLAALLPQVVGLFLMPVYTRYLGLSEFGAIAMVVSFSAFVCPFFGVQLNESFRRFYFDYHAHEARRYFSLVLLFIFVNSSLISVCLFISAPWWWNILNGVTQLPLHPYFELGLCVGVLSCLVTLCVNALVVEERGGAMLSLSIFRAVCGASVTLYLVVGLRWGAVGFLLGRVLSLLGTMVVGLCLNRHLLTWSVDTRALVPGLRYSLPLVPHALSNALMGYADRIILGQFVSLREIGLYDFADRIAKVFYQIVFAGDRAMTPAFIRLAKNGEAVVAFFRAFVVRWVMVVGVLYLGLALWSRHLLIFVIDESYHASYVFIPILCGAYWLRGYYLFGVKQLMFAKKTESLPVITTISGGINIVANIVLIPRFGVVMAAWTTVLSTGVAWGMARYLGQRCCRLDYSDRKTLPLAAGILMLACFGAVIALDSVWLDLFVKTLFVAFPVIIYYVTNLAGCREWFTLQYYQMKRL